MKTLIDLRFELIQLQARVKENSIIMKHIGDRKLLKKYDKMNRKYLRKIKRIKNAYIKLLRWIKYSDCFYFTRAFLVGLAFVGAILLATILLKGK